MPLQMRPWEYSLDAISDCHRHVLLEMRFDVSLCQLIGGFIPLRTRRLRANQRRKFALVANRLLPDIGKKGGCCCKTTIRASSLSYNDVVGHFFSPSPLTICKVPFLGVLKIVFTGTRSWQEPKASRSSSSLFRLSQP